MYIHIICARRRTPKTQKKSLQPSFLTPLRRWRPILFFVGRARFGRPVHPPWYVCGLFVLLLCPPPQKNFTQNLPPPQTKTHAHTQAAATAHARRFLATALHDGKASGRDQRRKGEIAACLADMAALVSQPAAPPGQEGNVFVACREAKGKLLALRSLLLRLDAAQAPNAGKKALRGGGLDSHSRHMAAADTLLLVAHTDTLVRPQVCVGRCVGVGGRGPRWSTRRPTPPQQ